MADAEVAQYDAIMEELGLMESQYLTCFFHMQLNIRKATAHYNDLITSEIKMDVTKLHMSKNALEFALRWSIIKQKWDNRGM
jgi:hypothetical protein